MFGSYLRPLPPILNLAKRCSGFFWGDISGVIEVSFGFHVYMVSWGSIYDFFTVHLWFLQGLFKVSYQDVFKVLFGFHLGSKEAKEQEVEQQKHMTEGEKNRIVEVERHRSTKAEKLEKQRSRKTKKQEKQRAEKQRSRKSKEAGKAKNKKAEKQESREAENQQIREIGKHRARNPKKNKICRGKKSKN